MKIFTGLIVVVGVVVSVIVVTPLEAQDGGARGLKTRGGGNHRGGNGRNNKMWSGMGKKGSFVGNDVVFFDADCDIETETKQCGISPRGPSKNGNSTTSKTTGDFVCRPFMNRNYTACIDEEEGMATDICGCCEGTCPEACNTPCTDVEDGVLIVLIGGRKGEKNRTKCVSALESVTAQINSQRQCA